MQVKLWRIDAGRLCLEFGLYRFLVYSMFGLYRFLVYSRFDLYRFLVYSRFCLYIFLVYSRFCLSRFLVYSRFCLSMFHCICSMYQYDSSSVDILKLNTQATRWHPEHFLSQKWQWHKLLNIYIFVGNDLRQARKCGGFIPFRGIHIIIS